IQRSKMSYQWIFLQTQKIFPWPNMTLLTKIDESSLCPGLSFQLIFDSFSWVTLRLSRSKQRPAAYVYFLEGGPRVFEVCRESNDKFLFFIHIPDLSTFGCFN